MTINYDIAQICLNGHIINKWSQTYPESRQENSAIIADPQPSLSAPPVVFQFGVMRTMIFLIFT